MGLKQRISESMKKGICFLLCSSLLLHSQGLSALASELTVSGADAKMTVSGANAGNSVSGMDEKTTVSGNRNVRTNKLVADPKAWYTDNPEAMTFSISTKAELAALAEIVNSGITFEGRTINLVADITIEEDITQAGLSSWDPIGNTYYAQFLGTFDGQGHTIRGLYINGENDYKGLFGYVAEGEVRNLTISNAFVKGREFVGAVVGELVGGTIQGVSVTNVTAEGMECVGGVVGNANYDRDYDYSINEWVVTGSTVKDCHADNTVSVTATGSYGKAGGIAGFAAFSIMEDCTNAAIPHYPGLTYIGGKSEDKLRIVYSSDFNTVRLQYNKGSGSWEDYYYDGGYYDSSGDASGVTLSFEAEGEIYQYYTYYFKYTSAGVENAVDVLLSAPSVSVDGTSMYLRWENQSIGSTQGTFDLTLEYRYSGGGTMERLYHITPRGTSLSDVKISYGGDTFFAGDDSGYDYAVWHEESGTKMLFIKQTNTAKSPAMYISSAEAAAYHAGYYNDGMKWAMYMDGESSTTNGSGQEDEGYFLRWDLGDVLAGAGKVVSATEGVDWSGTPLRIFAPNIPTFVAGERAEQIYTAEFVAANLTPEIHTLSELSVSVEGGSGVSARYVGSDSYAVGAAGSVRVPVEFTVSAGTGVQDVNVMLSGKDEEGNLMSVVATVSIKANPSISDVRLNNKTVTFSTTNVDKYEVYAKGSSNRLIQVTGEQALGADRIVTVPSYGTYVIYAYQGSLCVQCEVVVSEAEGGSTYATLVYDYGYNGGYGEYSGMKTRAVKVPTGSIVSLQGEGAEKANKDGWEFLGWSLNSTGTDVLKQHSMVGESSKLYAVYKKPVTVTFVHGDGTDGKTEKKAVLYNHETMVSVDVPQGIERAGYTFGWYTSQEGGVKLTSETVKAGADQTYYGRYELKPITVTGITGAVNKIYDASPVTLFYDVSHGLSVSYQWYKNGTLLAGKTGAVLALPGNVSESGTYLCKAVVSDGTTTKTSEGSVSVSIAKALQNPTISMSGYPYGGSKSEPSISGVKDGAGVMWYYTTRSLTEGGFWTEVVDGMTLSPGYYNICAMVAATGNYKSKTTDPVSFEVRKGSQTTPAQVQEDVTKRTSSSITLVEEAGYEYSRDLVTWKDNPQFTGLKSGTEYSFYQRKGATDYYEASLPGPEKRLRTYHLYSVTLPESPVGYRILGETGMVMESLPYSFTFQLAEGYSKQENFAVLVNGEEVELNGDGFYQIPKMEESVTVTVVGVADTTAPDGEVAIGENKWNSFFNGLTFGIFFKETKQVTITGSDKGSGMADGGISYLISATEMTEEELALADWVRYEGAVSVNPDRKLIVYARFLDNAGNSSYVNSNGVVLDGTKPLLSGIENGKSYIGEVIFGVTEENLKEVLVNGQPIELVGGQYQLGPVEEEKDYIVLARDLAGNETQMTVTLIPYVYDIRVNVPEFEAAIYGEDTAQTKNIKIENAGNVAVEIEEVSLISGQEAFELGGSGSIVPKDGNLDTYTLQPKKKLNVKKHTGKVKVTYQKKDGSLGSAECNVEYLVQKRLVSVRPMDETIKAGQVFPFYQLCLTQDSQAMAYEESVNDAAIIGAPSYQVSAVDTLTKGIYSIQISELNGGNGNYQVTYSGEGCVGELTIEQDAIKEEDYRLLSIDGSGNSAFYTSGIWTGGTIFLEPAGAYERIRILEQESGEPGPWLERYEVADKEEEVIFQLCANDGAITERISESIILKSDQGVPDLVKTTEEVEKESGRYEVRMFVQDTKSGINEDKISVWEGKEPVEYLLVKKENGYEIVFERKSTGDYKVEICDNVENKTEWKVSAGKPLYTVTYESGMDAQKALVQSHWQYRKVGIEKNTFVKEGYIFCGWEYAGMLYEEGDMLQMPGENVVFVAKWSKQGVASLIKGNVVYENGGIPKNAVVKIYREEEEIARDKTDANGNFTFSKIPNGTYRVVVTVNDGEKKQVQEEVLRVLDGKLLSKDGKVLKTLVLRIKKPDVVVEFEEKVEAIEVKKDGKVLTTEEIEKILEKGSKKAYENLVEILQEKREEIKEGLENYHDLDEGSKAQVKEETLKELDLLVKGTTKMSVELKNDSDYVEAPKYDNLFGLLLTKDDLKKQERATNAGKDYELKIEMAIHTLEDGKEKKAVQKAMDAVKEKFGKTMHADRFYDVTIVKKSGKSKTYIKRTPKEVELHFAMSQSMIAGSNHTVWRYHEEDNDVEIAKLSPVRVGNVQKTGSDRFSVFAVVYKPNKEWEDERYKENQKKPEIAKVEVSNGRKLDSVPKTGEERIVTILWQQDFLSPERGYGKKEEDEENG